ncbi:alanine dehydrogenase [Microbacterium sp. MPKO10]|uniref:alanine dehydrogenase n=1 Tax=Microbacterium sp. MPKO10 TaxID=2989818 RepID=UPI0022359C16|nr:alanine dehydrogenase [Microbacterium sp. MPKO10]MCW4459867.1 alanine dehydrogenase [Microbacterium sp. MPKO10]
MRIGIPTEIKNNESRVAITPAGVDTLVRHGHDVWVQSGAGDGSNIRDDDFAAAGAHIAENADETWARGDLLLKVKEPIEPEYSRMRSGQVLFTYLHLAASRACTKALIDAGTTAIAYETVQRDDGSLPLLAPMSEVAGRLSVTMGSYQLTAPNGGRGMLLGGIPGTPRAHVVVIGGGVAGEHAVRNAIGLGARVTVIDLSLPRLRQLEARFGSQIETRHSSRLVIAEQVSDADLVIGAVLVPGAAAPKLVTDEMVASMRNGSVLVDIAIDQGGCFERSRPTTHENPTFSVHNSLFYCVANIPGAVAATSTRALTNATLPYIVNIADNGWEVAAEIDHSLGRGVNVREGRLVNRDVAEALEMETEVVSA